MIEKLPEEILTRIIGHIDSCRDIGHCRQVCKQWSKLAEPLMFSKQILVKNNRIATSLFAHLCKRPEYGKLIKYIKFGDAYIASTVLEGLLPLVFTPSMVRMTGIVEYSYFYSILRKIADKQQFESFSHLKSIPAPTEYFPSEYDMVLLAFKDTLQEITVDMESDPTSPSSILDNIEIFRNLKKIKLDGTVLPLFSIEDSIRGCSGLEEISIGTKVSGAVRFQEVVQAWNPANVKIEKTVKKLSVSHECRSDLLEYLVFKYPNIETIEVGANNEPIVLTRHNLKRVLTIIKNINTYKVSFVIKESDLVFSLKDLTASGLGFVIKDAVEGFRIEINSQ